MTGALISCVPAMDLDARLRENARRKPNDICLTDETRTISWHELDSRIDAVAAALWKNGIVSGDCVAFVAANSTRYVEIMLGALRLGVCVVPLSPLVSPEARGVMIRESAARILFVDQRYEQETRDTVSDFEIVLLDELNEPQGIEAWLARTADVLSLPFTPVCKPEDPFNLIYSSGTTGRPKGIVQSRGYRSLESERMMAISGIDEYSRTIIATPLYSNTSLFLFFAVLAAGGAVRLMAKFDPANYLQLCEAMLPTDVILVPVQYRRLLDMPDFDSHDLSCFRNKFSTGAPLHHELKRAIVERWPSGGLTEIYGMTEGGVACILRAHENPGKLDTVGQAVIGCDVRVIDEQGNERLPGEIGEIIGWSPTMMTAYYGQPEATNEASWFDPSGRRFQRSGDIGWFDGDGFLHLLDRKKDVIISGGFNVYATDLEMVLLSHVDVADAAVVGAPSIRWGETPVAFAVLRSGCSLTTEQLRDWTNARLGKAQRLAAVFVADTLPRNPVGKILKRELRDRLSGVEEYARTS